MRRVDAIGLGGVWRSMLARDLSWFGADVAAWGLVETLRRREGASEAVLRLEAAVFLAAGNPIAAGACLDEIAGPETGAVRRLRARIAASCTRAPSARAGGVATRAGDWRALAPRVALWRGDRSALSAALARRLRLRTLLWWASRSGEAGIGAHADALVALDRFDEAIALADRLDRGAGHPTVPGLRIRTEVHFRRGDAMAFAREVADALARPRRPLGGVGAFGWLARLLVDHPGRPPCFDDDLTEAVVTLAALHDRPAVARRLARFLDAAHRRRLVALTAAGGGASLGTARVEAARIVVEANEETPEAAARLAGRLRRLRGEGGLPLHDWSVGLASVDAFAAVGDAATAQVVAEELAERRAGDPRPLSLAEVEALAGRFPASEKLAALFARIAEASGRGEIAAAARRWAERPLGSISAGLVGSARGRTCLLVGNGPSLADLPLAALADVDIDVMCVNRGFEATALGLPRPRHLVVADAQVYGDHKKAIDAAPVEHLFLQGTCVLHHPEGLPARVRPYGTSGVRLTRRPLAFAPWLFHRGASVVVIAAQIAAVLGYDEIRVIGVDLDYDADETHFYGGDPRDRERLVVFRTGAGGARAVDAAMGRLAADLLRRNIHLVNAGRGGRLESLPRVPFL